MAITLSVPDNVPVSWLQPLTQLCAGTLMLASEPGAETETQYMSKYFTYGFLTNNLCSAFDIDGIHTDISALCSEKVSKTDCFDNTICCNNGDIGTPYIISSMTQDWRGIISVDGYRLSSGIRSVILEASPNISTVIPSLSPKTTYLADPAEYYISAITDANGHIQSFGRAPLSTALSAVLPSATESCPTGNYLTSVTTSGGKVLSVGYKELSSILSQVRYKDFSRNSSTAIPVADLQFTDADLLNLNIMKLTKQQFDNLSVSENIEPSCIYMTVNDNYEE